MPGTLVISDLSDGTNSTSATNCIQGSAKAWVNFDGTGTPAIRASYNVSSITDNGTGDYTVNFITALPDANYSINISGQSANDATATVVCQISSQANPSAAACRIRTANPTVAYTDNSIVCVSVFR
jgi:autotransporter translocation and assembly factor TamB